MLSWFGKKSRDILVEWFDADTGKALRPPARVPPERLPATFEAETTMHVGEKRWTVERAVPMTALEYKKSGKLRLVLREVKSFGMIDPKEILYTLSTLCDELPGIKAGSTKLGVSVLEIHEDDWRQREFVSSAVQEAVGRELEAIRAIWATAAVELSEGVAFREVHVRKEVRAPLLGERVSLMELLGRVSQPTLLDGVSYAGVAGVIAHSFAARLRCGIAIYGQEVDGDLASLCIASETVNNVGTSEIEVLMNWAAERGLTLVDWCSATTFGPGAEGASALFVR